MENYSTGGQDLFVINYISKNNATYLDFGCGGPKNNTYLLEKKYNFQGLSIDTDVTVEEGWDGSDRDAENLLICSDFTTLDIEDALYEFYANGNIGYLSFTLPPKISIEVLKKISFEEYSFGIITYEHSDINVGLSRQIFLENGYKKVTTECMNEYDTTSTVALKQDWWFHPDVVTVPEQYIDNNL